MDGQKVIFDDDKARANVEAVTLRWGLIALLFVVGLGLCVAAFVTDARGWGGLGPSALLQFGGSIGLVGVLLIVERSLVRNITAIQREAVTVNAYVRRVGAETNAWDVWTVARPNMELEFTVRFENSGDSTLKDVMVANDLPKYTSYVNGTTRLRNGANPSGVKIDNDNIARGGINVGAYDPGAVAYVCFRVRTDPIEAYEKLGTHELRNVAVVRPTGLNEHYNIAKVLIDVPGFEATQAPPDHSKSPV